MIFVTIKKALIVIYFLSLYSKPIDASANISKKSFEQKRISAEEEMLCRNNYRILQLNRYIQSKEIKIYEQLQSLSEYEDLKILNLKLSLRATIVKGEIFYSTWIKFFPLELQYFLSLLYAINFYFKECKCNTAFSRKYLISNSDYLFFYFPYFVLNIQSLLKYISCYFYETQVFNLMNINNYSIEQQCEISNNLFQRFDYLNLKYFLRLVPNIYSLYHLFYFCYLINKKYKQLICERMNIKKEFNSNLILYGLLRDGEFEKIMHCYLFSELSKEGAIPKDIGSVIATYIKAEINSQKFLELETKSKNKERYCNFFVRLFLYFSSIATLFPMVLAIPIITSEIKPLF